jgi:hypothetical protein
MRWLAGLPWWLLAAALVLMVLGAVIGQLRSIPVVELVAVIALFPLLFATLMALVGRRETPRPPSPR